MIIVKGRVVSINISDKKGVRKKPTNEAEIVTDFGIKGDAHASQEWHRQVSLLALESVRRMQDQGFDVKPGDFAENITTEGIDLIGLPVGTPMKIGDVEVEVSQIGKECHTKCSIFYQAGACVMPKEGIFVKVLRGGSIKKGDSIEVQILKESESVVSGKYLKSKVRSLYLMDNRSRQTLYHQGGTDHEQSIHNILGVVKALSEISI